jgi:MFS family permease
VADRLGRRPAFAIYGIIAATGLVMISVFWTRFAPDPPVLLLFMLIAGFGIGFFSGFGPLFSELFPTAVRNLAMGAAFNIARGIQFFTPVIIALAAMHAGLEAGILIAAAFCLCIAGWIWVFPETRGTVIVGGECGTGRRAGE